MSDVQYFTEEGLEKLKQELQELKTTGRQEIARQIAEARAQGDLSENAEYDAAKDAQGMLEMKISQLESTLGNARVIDENELDLSKVRILSTIRIKNLNIDKEFEYTLVSEAEADIKEKKLSVSSPIGKGLLGKAVGDIAEVEVPNGTMKFEILNISR